MNSNNTLNGVFISKNWIALITLIISLIMVIGTLAVKAGAMSKDIDSLRQTNNYLKAQISTLYETQNQIKVSMATISTQLTGIKEDITIIKESLNKNGKLNNG